MLQDTAAAEQKYKLFIERVAATKLVWGLMNKQGWANSTVNDDDETDVIPFWSDRAFAKACARDDWRGYTATEIPLAEFLENWCIGMDENDTLVGTNWDANMFGQEIEPLQVAFDILTRLKAINTSIKFRDYSSVDEFLTEISE
ncbi:uncharacterized protein DUF2750 [Mucilaginibacter gracilis]|uniref:Uncharacterized protein DUF2750 n=1 Tax=Mucilaginibacter gracilis TaxID=423350 RepID=A0A495ITA9_9SPHI|nr:DUF2750 domain-containing protein [Mucilaginibacter gracilis]RKR80016.1 uncharacterized protein DUF2750 [Mucilaginibacter gracilis]